MALNVQRLVNRFSSLLESICVLLTSPLTAGQTEVCRTVRSLLQTLLATHHGMLYLLFHPSTTNVIIRTLLQTQVSTFCQPSAIFVRPYPSRYQVGIYVLAQDDIQEVGPNDDTESQQLGLQLAYNLYSLHLVDLLFNFHKQGGHFLSSSVC